jgi:hypothetical protein
MCRDANHYGPIVPRCKRPRGCRAAEQRDELAAIQLIGLQFALASQARARRLPLHTPLDSASETTMATIQHALARGLEVVFQLEEGEILTEPVPVPCRIFAHFLFLSAFATDQDAYSLWSYTSPKGAACDEESALVCTKAYTPQIQLLF